MLQNEVILINTSAPLRNYMKRRPTHYAEILSRTNRVINISSAPLKHYFRFKNTCRWEEKIFFRLPGTKSVMIQKLNKKLYVRFLKKSVKDLPRKPILWNFYSGNFDMVKSMPNKISVLEICDDTPEFFRDNPEKYQYVRENENKMAGFVDVVFTVSDYLKEKRISLRPDIKVIRNGVNYEDFADVPGLSRTPSDELYSLTPPIVGYTGAVSHWFDFGLVGEVAGKLPDVHFVFVGRILPEKKESVKRLSEKSNILFLGERPYPELPHYLKYFDLAHIPFVSNELVRGVNPIKLYEYLAAGKRVVSTPMPEVGAYQREGVIEVADGAEEYALALERMLRAKAEKYIETCQRMARENTWEARVEEAGKIIRQRMKELNKT